MQRLTEKCAVFGAYNIGKEAARTAFYGLWALQHRGQESSGIVSSDGVHLHQHASGGLVANVYREEDLQMLAGTSAIGHNRYSTSGKSDDGHMQPILLRDFQFSFAHNGNLPDTSQLEKFFRQRHISFAAMNDSEMMAAAIGYYIAQGFALEVAVTKAYPLFQGAFSAIAMGLHTMVAFRDHCGIRPLVIGKLGQGFIVASETCALDTVGATFLREVAPGEMVVFSQGKMTSNYLRKGSSKLDIFEFVYFARPDSNLLGRNVNLVRQAFGKELAKEHHINADMVIPVPDSAIPAAQGYANATGLPFEMAIIKNRYIHRTFIRPTPELRERDLQMKLHPIPEIVKGKRVIIVDDSIVRGTTTKKIVQLLKNAGAVQVHILVSSPPVLYPDFYGINTPNQAELIAAQMDDLGIADYLEADSLGYLSYQGMIRATGLPSKVFSTSCFNGVYPIGIGARAKEFAKAR